MTFAELYNRLGEMGLEELAIEKMQIKVATLNGDVAIGSFAVKGTAAGTTLVLVAAKPRVRKGRGKEVKDASIS